jgi:hypothetical protein
MRGWYSLIQYGENSTEVLREVSGGAGSSNKAESLQLSNPNHVIRKENPSLVSFE